MSADDTCPKCGGPLTDVSNDGTYSYAHAPGGVICLRRQVAKLKVMVRSARERARQVGEAT